jgi:hypothetical protein
VIGQGHPLIIVWRRRCVVCVGMAGFVALGEIYVKTLSGLVAVSWHGEMDLPVWVVPGDGES